MDLSGKAALDLAVEVSYLESPWWVPVLRTPRHLLAERWFVRSNSGWIVPSGPSDPEGWRAAYADRELVTRVGTVHADHVAPGEPVNGTPTSALIRPSLAVKILGHGRLTPDSTLLDVGTGPGYTAALACRRLGNHNVTTIDIDPYVTQAAARRLDRIGCRPQTLTGDATGPLPGTYDRIVSTAAVPSIPAAWLAALNTGGRLVTTLADTDLTITAGKNPDGGATGHVAWSPATCIPAAADTSPPLLNAVYAAAVDHDGDSVTTSPLPVPDLTKAPHLQSMLTLTLPGIRHRTVTAADGTRTPWMIHPSGSWARATQQPHRPTTVHQTGPHRLYDHLEAVRRQWGTTGELPLRGARVTITPDGRTTLSQRGWTATL